MYGSIHDIYASSHRQDLMTEAEHARRLAMVPRSAPAAAIRRQLGAVLIQTGRRVQGAQRPVGAGAPLLRTAR